MPPPDGALQHQEPDTESAAVGAGLDALDTPVTEGGRPWWLRFALRALPPIVAIVALIALWQALWAAAIWPEYQLPSPSAVWAQISERIGNGDVFGFLWVSVHRAVIGFLIALAV